MTDFGRHKATVANVIPPQQAGRIADTAGVADRTGARASVARCAGGDACAMTPEAHK